MFSKQITGTFYENHIIKSVIMKSVFQCQIITYIKIIIPTIAFTRQTEIWSAISQRYNKISPMSDHGI